LKFSSRTLFGVVALVALISGWFSTWQKADRASRMHEQQLLYAEQELERARDQVRDLTRGKQPNPARSFWEAELEGSNLTGMTITSTENAFQRASFRNCGLEKATLKGGGASFQFACFDDADLAQATLIGGGASFQGSTFVRDELTGATLAGGPGSFQSVSFEDAILVGAKLEGSFQATNISGAKFEGADISAIGCDDLNSCYFKSPPTYNAATKFPKGFDPREQLWRWSE
jgi:Pentapeptide repeats (8 copies)